MPERSFKTSRKAARETPPVGSKVEGVRHLHVHEDDELDEQQLASWIQQASKLPGEALF